jgi:enoyl-CoA hydratase/carnithine racemase
MGDIISVTDAGILRLRLNRPAKKNAITRAMYEDLTEGLVRASNDDAVRAVVITAEGGDFCAGNDILDFAQGLGDFQSVPLDDLPVFRFLRALTFFEKPLVAGVQGQAVGIGVTLLLHCDLAVVSDDVRLSLPFLKLGLVPEAGSTLLLPRRIGHARAFAWMASGEAMGAEEAHQLGLVNAVVDASAVTRTSEDMAAKLLRLSPSSLKHTKRLMRDPEALWQVVRTEGEIFRQQLQSPEAIAAFTAFLNR